MNSSKFLCCGLSEIENIICPELPAKMRIDRENNSFHTYFLQVTVLIRLVSCLVSVLQPVNILQKVFGVWIFFLIRNKRNQ